MRYLIEAFIVSASIPHGAIFYFLVQTNPLSFVGQILYAINVSLYLCTSGMNY